MLVGGHGVPLRAEDDRPHFPEGVPHHFDEVDPEGFRWRFYRTEIERAEHLTNGKAWIQVFEHVLQNPPKRAESDAPRPRRQLRAVVSDSGVPSHSMQGYAPKLRNEAVKNMRDRSALKDLPEGARGGVGKLLRFPNNEEALVICNVGPRAAKDLPRKFRDMPLEELSIIAIASKCPHQGGHLIEGELIDVEELAAPGTVAGRQAIIRCPWHNYQFDLHTGEGLGNHCTPLRRYPVTVKFGALYVAMRGDHRQSHAGPGCVGCSWTAPSGAAEAPAALAQASDATGGDMDVDMEADLHAAAVPVGVNDAAAMNDMAASGYLAAAMALLGSAIQPPRGRSRSPSRQLRPQHTIS